METKTARAFKLISNSGSVEKPQPFTPTNGVQQSLFPLRNPRSAFFVSLPDVDHVEFVQLLKNSGPAVIVELRKIPRFDIGPLNRRSIFDLFRQQGDIYLDFGTEQFEKSNPHDVASSIEKRLQDHLAKQRPILFLTSSAQNPPSLSQSILDWLRKSSEPWEVYEVPQHVPRRVAGM
ncbi:MAG: toll/interleukin receptor protein [Candidatus Sulfotelmatobacter sp.]|nr:toll/interleukin receptor protein [Candidatus Sulfotelmatobacter sp.]